MYNTDLLQEGKKRRNGCLPQVSMLEVLAELSCSILYTHPSCPRNICFGKLSKFSFQASLEKKKILLPELRKTFWTHSIHHVCGCVCVCLRGRRGGRRGKHFQLADGFSSGWKRHLKSMEPGWVTAAEDLGQAAAMLCRAVVWRNLNRRKS